MNLFDLENYCKPFKRDDDNYNIVIVPLDMKVQLPINEASCLMIEKPKYFGFFENLLNMKEYWINEMQYKSTTHSGIMFDVDFLQNNSNQRIQESDIYELFKICMKSIENCVNVGDFETYGAVLTNKDLEPVNNSFKEGVHILFPSVKVDKITKRNIMNYASHKIAKNFNKKYKGGLDEHSYYVPVHIYGSIRKGKSQAHILNKFFKIKFGNLQIIDYKEPIVNIPLELSIHFNGNIINEKKQFEGKNIEKAAKIQFLEAEQDPIAKIKKEVTTLLFTDYNAVEIYNYVGLLDYKRGESGQYKEWKNVMQIIANISPKYKPLAKYFSVNASSTSWFKGGEAELNKIFQEVKEENKKLISKESNKIKFKNILRSLAQKDNPVEFNSVKDNWLINIIKNDIIKGLTLQDMLLSKYIYLYAKDYFKFYPIPLAGLKDHGIWYELILEKTENKRTRPFINKWFSSYEVPDGIYDYTGQKMIDLYEKIKSQFRNEKVESKEEEAAKKAKIKFVSNAITKLGNQQSKLNLFSVLKRKLQDKNISFDFDNKKGYFGVGNGILIFEPKKEAIFIDKYDPEVNITRTTNHDYVPYDPENQYVKEVMALLKDILPEEGRLEAVLMHFSTLFYGSECSRYFTILLSGGGSGKSILMLLFQNALGFMGSSQKYGEGFGYYQTIQPVIFQKEKKDPNGVDHHTTMIANAKLINIPEAPKGQLLESEIKKIRELQPARKMYGENQGVRFEGIISFVTNFSPDFAYITYAMVRRTLLINFNMRFCENPTYPNEKKINTKYEKLAEDSPEWGKAFLSILVHHWNLLTKTNLNEVYEKSGLLADTIKFYNSKDNIIKFKEEKTCVVEGSKILVSEFCKKYIEWFNSGKKFQFSIDYQTLYNDVKEKFSKIIVAEEEKDYFINLEFVI